MKEGRTVFSQLMDWFPRYEFDKCAKRYQGNHRVKTFSCWEQFLTMVFAQLTYRESLRDIETCLRALQPKLYHSGIRTRISRSTLADANENRDCRIFADFAQTLIGKARRLYTACEWGTHLSQTAYVLDATTIDLCLTLFPWAQFRRHKSAIKLHTLFDLRGNIPTIVIVTSGRISDGPMLKNILIEPGSFYIMDRAYRDLVQLYKIHRQQAFFVIRSVRNQDLRRLYSHPIDKLTGLQCDQTVRFDGPLSKTKYPDRLRRVRYLDPLTQKRLVFLTNNFNIPALTVADLYRRRWQIELFFKWIKQHLRIKAFYGTSENAVKTQVWIAIATYVLVAIIKKELRLQQSLYTILQILSVTIFEKTPISQAFSDPRYISEFDIFKNEQKQRVLPGF
jgi:hypothetical protein